MAFGEPEGVDGSIAIGHFRYARQRVVMKPAVVGSAWPEEHRRLASGVVGGATLKVRGRWVGGARRHLCSRRYFANAA